MTPYDQLHKLIAPLLERGWYAEVTYGPDGDFNVRSIYGGDCNCSHRKHYDPSDGHGWTHLNEGDGFESDCEDDFEFSMDIARQMVQRALELEGQE